MSAVRSTPHDGTGATMEKEAEVSGYEVERLRQDVLKEIRVEDENLVLIGKQRLRAQRLSPLLVVLVVINLILALLIPHYGISWIVASFLIYMYYFIVLFFPTTRRVRTPADKLEGKKARPKPQRIKGLRSAAMRGKKTMVIAFWNSFFIGTQTLAWGIALIMTISIIFALTGLLRGILDPLATVVIIAQAGAIMGYYYIIIHYRPYSKEFLRTVARVRRDKKAEVRWQAYLKGVFLVLLLLTVFVIFLISAIFLPRQSLDIVLFHVNQEFALALLQVIVIFASQFIIIRYIQGFYSARVAKEFIIDKEGFLKDVIMSGLDSLPRVTNVQDRSAQFHSLRRRFHVSRIYKVAYKDIFGILPTYPIILDLWAIMNSEVADSLDEEMPLDIPAGEKREASG